MNKKTLHYKNNIDSTPKLVYYSTAEDVVAARTKIEISRQALKDLKKTPIYIQEKFRAWLFAVDKSGLFETRKRPGWHDEPLQGNRKGQRSIRLNKQWRAIYIVKDDGKLELIEVIEVHPHEY